MKKLVFCSLAIILSLQFSFAQDSKLDQKLAKAEAYLADENYNKADKVLTKTLKDHPTSGKAWDLLSKTHLIQYRVAKSNPDNFANFTVTTKTKDGEPVENDSLAVMLANLINARSPEKLAFSKAKHTMRQAMIHTNDAYMSSIYIRNYMVDQPKDTGISDEAWAFFNDAEKEFQKKNFNQAAVYYQKALDIDPKFYSASLYLGDAYYHLKYYLQASDKFKEAIVKFPNELEPRKYLVDAYFEEGLYEKARIEAIAAMEVYPDLIMAAKLRNAAYYSGKQFNLKWTPRGILPNRISSPFTPSFDAYEDETPDPVEPWAIYEAALEKVRNDCNSKGIITESNLTDQRYLEVYSWEEMLANSKDPILDEARRMQKLGYLDCYVLVTCFHIDFYDQYLDFVKANPQKVTAYFNSILDRE